MTTSSNYNSWVHAMAVLVAAMCLFMIVAGGMVTSMNAGDSVPDWPLSYGSLLPPMIGNVFWEHGHRLVGMVLGLLTIALTITLARRESRKWVRTLGYIALPAVCLQGVLGGFRVKIISSESLQDFLFTEPTGANVETLRIAVAIIHTASAQAILCLMAAIAVVTSRRWMLSSNEPLMARSTTKLRILCVSTTAMVFVQLLLGALRRQTDGTIVYHAVGAFLVAMHVGLISRRVFVDFSQAKPLVKSTSTILILTGFQLVLGLYSWMLTSAAIQQSLHLPQIMGSAEMASAVLSGHLAIGAMLLALSVVITMRSYRYAAVPAPSADVASSTDEKGLAPA